MGIKIAKKVESGELKSENEEQKIRRAQGGKKVLLLSSCLRVV